jgi:formylglycine-generating enzyme required for sulfatase activity
MAECEIGAAGGAVSTGGVTGGGGDGNGGDVSSGGVPSTGGVASSGGTGGAPSTGGVLGSGGAPAADGAVSTGGAGGTVSTGGAGGAMLTGGTTSRGGTGGATSATPPSCQGLATTCGANNESCCTSPLVTGGTFYRSYDGATYTSQAYPATVSDFRLDKFEVTVGRFRQFKAAWDGGWRPSAGAGKHAHLNGGSGLMDSSGTTPYETGWDTAWASTVAPNDANLVACNAIYATWTSNAGANEQRPINCIRWYEAYAFCIWDGGFLPSEAEWNYAASGGAEQRVYPWGNGAPGANATLAVYGCYYNGTGSCTTVSNIAPVGSAAAGNGKYGQSDLGGNVWEWNLDRYVAPHVVICSNCSYLTRPDTSRVLRGGSFSDDALILLASRRSYGAPTSRGHVGARCARTP